MNSDIFMCIFMWCDASVTAAHPIISSHNKFVVRSNFLPKSVWEEICDWARNRFDILRYGTALKGHKKK